MQDGSEFVLNKIEEACEDVVDMVEDGVDALVSWWDKVVEKKNEKVSQLIKAIETSYNVIAYYTPEAIGIVLRAFLPDKGK
ncbi:MAG: hypothetical protein OCC49_20040, partial [Fibrobacterales bacterium]